MPDLTNQHLQDLVPQLTQLATAAGDAILAVYHHADGFSVDHKADDSPLTQADLAAHNILHAGLVDLLPGVPVLSEESALPSFAVRSSWSRYWLIDPLDGTKEFVNRNGEFTVNIALIDQHRAVFGMVYVPVLGLLYYGGEGLGAFKVSKGQSSAINTRTVASRIEQSLPVELVASRNHGADAVEKLMARLETATGRAVATKNMGSSLKLCLVAEGEADLYPRLALTSEWDTAAAQAIVEAAGGQVVKADFSPLGYNQKDDILNPWFYVIGDPSFDWQSLL